MRKIVKAVAVATSLTIMSAMLAGCSSESLKEEKSEDYIQEYVEAVMDCSYKGELDPYVENTDADEDDAEEVYEACTQYYAKEIMYLLDVNYEVISEDILNEYYEFGKEIMMNSKYSVGKGKSTGDDSWEVIVKIQPIDMIALCEDELQEYADSFAAKYADLDTSSMTEEDFIPYEDEFAEGVLDVLEAAADNIEYGDEIEYTVEVTEQDDAYKVSDDQWNEIDDLVVGMDNYYSDSE